MSKKGSLIAILLSAGMLSACVSQQPQLVNYAMDCDELMVEIQKTRKALTQAGEVQEVSRGARTGATVAAHGAGIAGVPYVGPIIAIGTTLFSHHKQTQQIEKTQTQSYLNELTEQAKRENCGEEYLY